jgi:hypothetical protein
VSASTFRARSSPTGLYGGPCWNCSYMFFFLSLQNIWAMSSSAVRNRPIVPCLIRNMQSRFTFVAYIYLELSIFHFMCSLLYGQLFYFELID